MLTIRLVDQTVLRALSAPLWLVHSVLNLDSETFSTTYPKTMSAIATLLVVLGSIPSIAVTAGTGGVVAGPVAQHVGAAAVTLGNRMSDQLKATAAAKAAAAEKAPKRKEKT